MSIATLQVSDRRTYRFDDYMAFPDDLRRHEIIGGVHYARPSPPSRHQAVLGYLCSLLYPVGRGEPGEVLLGPLAVVLSDTDVVEPDLMWISQANRSIVTEQYIQGAPDLVIEVLAPDTRDYDEELKRDLYERFGVLEYWTVDLEVDVIRIRRLEAGAYGPPVEHAAEDDSTVTTPLLPDWSMSVRECFS